MIDKKLWDAYCDPYFRFSTLPSFESYAVVTAWNPRSIRASDQDNLIENDRLEGELLSCRWVNVCVGDVLFSWSEESFACELDRQTAVELGRKYHQNAIYFVEKGQIFLLSCLKDETEILIGSMEQRCQN